MFRRNQTIDFDFEVNRIDMPKRQLVAFVRFLVATRHLAALMNSLILVQRNYSKEYSETAQIVTYHIIGSAKEAADGFRDCDSTGVFNDYAEEKHPKLISFQTMLRTARHGTDKNSADSLYCKILKPFRDNVAFHISGPEVERALLQISDRKYKPLKIAKNGGVASVPLVQDVMAHATWGKLASAEEFEEVLMNAIALNDALGNIAQAFFVSIAFKSTL